MMWAVVVPVCLIALGLLIRRRQSRQVQDWVHEQLDVANFRYAGITNLQDRLRLRAAENRRLKAAFGIENSLTTESPAAHRQFLRAASQILNREDRSWAELYDIAASLAAAELRTVTECHTQPVLPLAELVRCIVLAVVLSDSFGVDASRIARSHLVIITDEINKQWLLSKRNPDGLAPSERLNATIRSLGIKSRFPTAQGSELGPAEVLSLLMPQYETLWRVVLLTFVTAYHHQPEAYPDAERRMADVPSCLGDPTREQEALKLAKEGLRLYSSNKHLYRSHHHHPGPSSPSSSPPSQQKSQPQTTTTISADISALHRHPAIWGRDALAFRPARFGAGVLTALQREAYVPFSVSPHKCPAAGRGFGERMVVVLVAALGAWLGPRRGRVGFGDGDGKGEGSGNGNGNGNGNGRGFWGGGFGGGNKELPTGRDQMEGWVFEVGVGARVAQV